jgi:hypothetical protein
VTQRSRSTAGPIQRRKTFTRLWLAPLLRLAAEDIPYNASGDAADYSVGDLEAVSCTDYPQVWNPSASIPVRKNELATAVANLKTDVFAPITNSVYLSSYDENELVYGCLDWKTSPLSQPTFPAGIHYPHIPVLIFDGQFDQATPVADALKVAEQHLRRGGELQLCHRRR